MMAFSRRSMDTYSTYPQPAPLYFEEEVEMKRYFIVVFAFAILLALSAGCGGGNAAAPAVSGDTGTSASSETVGEPTTAEDTAAPIDAAEGGEAADVAPADEAATGEETTVAEPVEAAEPAVDDPNMVAGLPASGIDPETGLEINPEQFVPGVDFIVRGRLVSFNLTPQDSPEFLIESPSGTRYRVNSQPVPAIAFADGTTLLPHEYQRGLLAQATVRQEEGAGVTTVVTTDNLVLLAQE
jgi:hypothetical protein